MARSFFFLSIFMVWTARREHLRSEVFRLQIKLMIRRNGRNCLMRFTMWGIPNKHFKEPSAPAQTFPTKLCLGILLRTQNKKFSLPNILFSAAHDPRYKLRLSWSFFGIIFLLAEGPVRQLFWTIQSWTIAENLAKLKILQNDSKRSPTRRRFFNCQQRRNEPFWAVW